MTNIVITGASSGIGRALAKMLDSDRYHIIICGRNKERLEQLSSELKGSNEIRIFDVKDKDSVFENLDSVDNIDILINNAGNAHGLDTFDKMPLTDMEEMIMGNVMGLIYVSKACVEKIKKSSSPHIVNISSIAGKDSYRNGTVYCASKSAVEMLSQGMRLDLIEYGVRVTNVAPGLVHTGFSNVRFKGDEDRSESVYKGYDPLQAEDIARQIINAIESPANVQISDITILPTAQANSTTVHKK